MRIRSGRSAQAHDTASSPVETMPVIRYPMARRRFCIPLAMIGSSSTIRIRAGSDRNLTFSIPISLIRAAETELPCSPHVMRSSPRKVLRLIPALKPDLKRSAMAVIKINVSSQLPRQHIDQLQPESFRGPEIHTLRQTGSVVTHAETCLPRFPRSGSQPGPCRSVGGETHVSGHWIPIH